MQHIFDTPIPDIAEARTNQIYYPWTQAQAPQKPSPIQDPIISFMKARGHVFSSSDGNGDGQWYVLNKDTCIYSKETEHDVSDEIYQMLNISKPQTDINISKRFVNDCLSRLAASSRPDDLEIRLRAMKGMCADHQSMTGKVITPSGTVILSDKSVIPNNRYVFMPDKAVYVDSAAETGDCDAEFIFDHIFFNKDAFAYYAWWVGQTLFSNNVQKIIPVFYGASNSGKTTILKPVEQMLGCRAINIDLDKFDQQSGTALLKGRRLAIFNEADGDGISEAKRRTSTFKKLTGGDKIIFNPKYVAMSEGVNTANVVMLCNRFPDLYMADAGLINRLRVIRFDHDQDEFHAPMTLQAKICSPKNVKWLFDKAVDLWLEYGENGDKILSQKLVKEDKREMLMSNPFNAWIDDYARKQTLDLVEITNDLIASVLDGADRKHLYDDYCEFIRDDDESRSIPLSNQKFYDLIRTNYRMAIKKTNGKYVFERI